jgi:PAS domain S-box-containing protein
MPAKKKRSDSGTMQRFHRAGATAMRPKISSGAPAPRKHTKKQYEELYNKYANLFELAPNAHLLVDQSGAICEANHAAAIMLNGSQPKNDLLGRSMARFIRHRDRDTFDHLIHDCLKSRDQHVAELEMVQVGGRRFPAQIQLRPFSRGNKCSDEFRVIILDLSEQARISDNMRLLHDCLEIAVQAADAKQLLEAYVRQIKNYTKCSAVGIRLRDEAGRIPYEAYEGFSRQFYEKESPLVLHSDQCLCIKVIKGMTNSKKSYFTDFGSFFINGTTRFMATVPQAELGPTRNVCNAEGYESVALVPINIDQTISGLIHVADNRENKFPRWVVEMLEQVAMRLGLALHRLHMQSQLYETVQSLRELFSHLFMAKEEEHRRMAMELHDQTGQDLNVLKLRIKQLQDRLPLDHPGLKQSCGEMMVFADQIIETVRRLIHGLNPASLEAIGLRAAVEQMVCELGDCGGYSTQTDIKALERVVSHKTQINIYRIIQEAMTNINKHARATRVAIKAIEDQDASTIRVVVKDNGKGFAIQKILWPEGRKKGMGLSIIEERSRMIGGQMTIQSRPGQGTCITISLPA